MCIRESQKFETEIIVSRQTIYILIVFVFRFFILFRRIFDDSGSRVKEKGIKKY